MIPVLQELGVHPLLNFGACVFELLGLTGFTGIMDLISLTSQDNFEKCVAQSRQCKRLSFFWLTGMKSEGLKNAG